MDASLDRKETAGGQATRHHIMEVALDLFGQWGYRAVTVRQIADAADVNLSAIKYHFGGKEELYLLTVRSLLESVETLIGPHLQILLLRIAEGAGNHLALRAAAEEFATNWANQVLANPDVQRRMPVLAMELAAPSAAADIIFDRFYNRLYDVLRELSVYGALDDSRLGVSVRVHAAAGLLLSFVSNERVLWRSLGWSRYCRSSVTLIAPHLAAAFADGLGLPRRRYLDAPGTN
jgi:TetR/AcrR family transcriptional regulator, regulator of cefoperazone and chloramphenicol sensitivity